MKRTTRFLAPLLFASLLPATVGADDRSRGYNDYDSRRAADSDYGKYKKHKDSGRYGDRSLRDLAHDLEGWTRSANREADRQYRDRYRDRYRESDALIALDRLAEEARRFRREVDKSSKHRDLERRDFVALERAYFDASSSLRGLRADRKVRETFDRVHDTMDRIAYYYGGLRREDWRDGDRYGDRDGYDRYDRYDRDR